VPESVVSKPLFVVHKSQRVELDGSSEFLKVQSGWCLKVKPHRIQLLRALSESDKERRNSVYEEMLKPNGGR